MSEHVPRLHFSVDPLMAEAKRRARQRRLLALVLLLVVGATGATLALRGSGGSGPPAASTAHGFTAAKFGQASVTYPVSWKRVEWNCWIGAASWGHLLLTTARPTPTCGSSLPPREKLGRNGVAVWLWSGYPGGVPPFAGTSRTLIRDPRPMTGAWSSEAMKMPTCASGARRRFGARFQLGNFSVLMGAVVCGPNYGQGERALQRMVSTAGPTE